MVAPGERPCVAFKSCPSDFVVEEDLGLDFTGEGEHGYFFVEKRDRNTADVVQALIRTLACQAVDIGFAGLKDKRAHTRQWFSIKGVFDWPPLDDPNVNCLATQRHTRKLRRGMHRANRFEVILRDASPTAIENIGGLAGGFANYFGSQRVNSTNCAAARDWLSRRRQRGRRKPGGGHRRGWHLSVLRSELFNAVLTARDASRGFPAPLPGDDLMDGVPTGPLWGRGRSTTEGEALCVENSALAPYAEICEQLEYAGVDQARRPLWVVPQEFAALRQEGDVCSVRFTLPPGAYATSLLSQAVTLRDSLRG